MTRLRRLLQPVNWQYAAGELVLLIVGIFLGLQINAWYEARQDQRTEVATLRELRMALAQDLEDAGGNLSYYEASEQSASFLIDYMASGQPYADSLDAHFGRVLGSTTFLTNNAAYETLKSRGLHLISNDSLRLQIVRLQTHDYVFIKNNEDGDEVLLFSHLWPYYMRHFEKSRFFTSASPRNYAEIRVDPHYRSLLNASLSARQVLVPSYRELIREIEEVAAALDAEIARLQ